MTSIPPVIRQMILCDDITADPARPLKVSILGLITYIDPADDPPYPLLYRELCVYLKLSGCRGAGTGWIQVRNADSGTPVCRTPARPLQLPTDPLRVVGRIFRVRDCRFPELGLYEVEFWYDGMMLRQEPVVLR